MKVVIIDDEPSIRDSFQWFLEDLGYDVVTADKPSSCDVYHGHDCSKESACGDALIIDFDMPGMNGLEFVEQLSSRGCKGMMSNILVISGNAYDLDREKANQLGCAVLQKPVYLDVLKDWLEKVRETASFCSVR